MAGANVLLAFALLRETHPTEVTDVGPLPRVHQHVALEGGELLEGGGAGGALVPSVAVARAQEWRVPAQRRSAARGEGLVHQLQGMFISNTVKNI